MTIILHQLEIIEIMDISLILLEFKRFLSATNSNIVITDKVNENTLSYHSLLINLIKNINHINILSVCYDKLLENE